jgi:hypothetical protein
MSRKARLKDRKEKQQLQSQNQQMMVIAGIVAIVAIIAAIAWFSRQQSPLADVDLSAVPDNSVPFESQGRDHIEVGDPHDPYNSNPPTSGPHAPPMRTDFYTRQYPDENLIHNLEHGHIWLSYRDENDTEAKDLLQSIQSQFPNSVIVTFRPNNDARISVAAWQRLLQLETADENQIMAFISRYRDKAPESVPGR